MPGTVDLELLASTQVKFVKAGGELRKLHAYKMPLAERTMRSMETNRGGRYLMMKFQDREDVDESAATRINPLGLGNETLRVKQHKTLDAVKVPRGIVAIAMALGLTHKIENNGSTYDTARNLTESAHRQLKKLVTRQFWRGDGGDPVMDFLTANGTDYADGFLETRAHGANTNVVWGGIDKGALASLRAANNWWYDCNNNFASNFRNFTLQAVNDVKWCVIEDQTPDWRWFMNRKTSMNWFKNADARSTYMNADPIGEHGRLKPEDEFLVAGLPASQVDDDDLPRSGTESSTQKWGAVLHDASQMGMITDEGFDQQLSPWKEVPHIPGLVISTLIHSGQFAPRSFGTLALITNSETYGS